MSSITVEVALAFPEQQTLVTVQLAAGGTVQHAIDASGLMASHPDLDWPALKTGVFSRLCGRDHVLREGDRVEVYRPLLADPKQARRQRAAAGPKPQR